MIVIQNYFDRDSCALILGLCISEDMCVCVCVAVRCVFISEDTERASGQSA